MDKDLELVRAWCAYWTALAQHQISKYELVGTLSDEVVTKLRERGLL